MNSNLLIFFGFIVGLVSGVVIADAVGLAVPSNGFWTFAGSAFGAGLAALAAIWAMERQMRSRRDEAEAGRRRQQLGARAILASDLGRIINYAEKSVAEAKRGDQINEAGETQDHVPCPELEADILLRLQRLVELLEGDNADQVVCLMHCYQIQHSRLKGILDNMNFPNGGRLLSHNNFTYTLQGTVELYLRAEAMFPFARQPELDSIEAPPFSNDRVVNAFWNLDIGEEWPDEVERNNIIDLMTTLPPHGRWRRR